MRNDSPASDLVRLNKYLSECGVVSRRKADSLIEEGKVMVNGKKVYELGIKISPSQDRVTVSGKPVKSTSNKVYIMFNKPKNVVTTMEDPEGRTTIADFFERLPVRVFPVGRLDWDTEGMILLTNDGDFAQRVNHPSEEVYKTYLVKIGGKIGPEQIEKLMRGVSIIGGKVAAKGVERIRRGADKYDWVKIMISEGKNRQVRHMFEKVGFDVLKLQRVAIGRLRMGNLKRGEYVFLTQKGIEKIFQREPLDSKGRPIREQKNVTSDKRAGVDGAGTATAFDHGSRPVRGPRAERGSSGPRRDERSREDRHPQRDAKPKRFGPRRGDGDAAGSGAGQRGGGARAIATDSARHAASRSGRADGAKFRGRR